MKLKKLLAGLLSTAMLLSMVSFPAKAANTLGDGLVLYSSFDDETANDLSTNGRNGTLTGAIEFAEGKSGKAVKIAGQKNPGSDTLAGDRYISYGPSVGIIPATENFSVSVWFKSEGQSQSNACFLGNKDYSSGSKPGFVFGVVGAGQEIVFNFAKSGATSAIEMAPGKGQNYPQMMGVSKDGQWHHLVCTYNRMGNMVAYVDGQKAGTLAISAQSGSIESGLDLVLGAGGNGKNAANNCYLDELRVYNRVLTEAEIALLYNTPDGTGDPEKAERDAEIAKVTAIKTALAGITADGLVFTQSAIEEMEGKVAAAEANCADSTKILAEIKALVAALEAEYKTFLAGAEPDASFHLISDVHIPGSSGTDANSVNYKKGMEGMKAINAGTTIAFVNAGDNTNNSTEAEYNGFYALTAANSPVDAAQTLIALGNHDVRGPGGTGQANWFRDPRQDGPTAPDATYIPWETTKARYLEKNAAYMPDGATTTYHSKVLGGYTFIVLNPEKNLKDAMYMSPAQLTWLEDTMKTAYAADPAKPIFIIGHQPLNDTHWLGNTLDGFDGITADGSGQPYQTGADAKVKEIMAKYPTGIYLSGHIHNEFGRAELILRPWGAALDLPSFGSGGVNIKELGTGWEVYIYGETVVFRAVNYITGQWYPQYDVVLNSPGSYVAPYQAAQEVLSDPEEAKWYSEADLVALDTAYRPLHTLLTNKYDQSALTWDSLQKAPKQLYQSADHTAIEAKAAALGTALKALTRLSEPRKIVTFADLKANWRSYLLGGTGANLDMSVTAVAAHVQGLNTEANTLYADMAKSTAAGRTNLWADLNMVPRTDSGNVAETFMRLRTIARAWATKGTDLYQSVEVTAELISALDHMLAHHYYVNGTLKGYGNWYGWQISGTTALLNIVVILDSALTAEQVTQYATAAKFYSPYADKTSPNAPGITTITGGNLLLKANNVAQIGILLEESAMLDNVKSGVKTVLVNNPYSKLYTSDADGFYADGSYIQHQALPWIGGYGKDLYDNLGVFLVTLKNSTWEISYGDASEKVAYDFVFSGIEPFLYDGRTMDMVSSRDVTRKGSNDRIRTARILSALMPLRGTFPTAGENARFDSMLKYHLSKDTEFYYTYMESITSIQKAAQLMADAGILPRAGYELTKTFAMDKTVHITPDFGFGISMHSSRTYGHEIINDEGKQTWNVSDGMFYLYDADKMQYGEGYWATVDPTRLPGITAEHLVFNKGMGDRTKNIYPWTGGANIGGSGVAGSQFKTLGQVNSSTRNGTDVKKSWFMFGDRILMMGSDITSATGNVIESIVDNRKIKPDGSNAITVDGKTTALTGEETTLTPGWMHLEGNVPGADVGYYFPGRASIKAIKDARTGNWSNQGTTTGEEINTYATFWYDHGTKPTNAGYQYILLPGKTAAQTAAYAAAPDVEILRRDGQIHAAVDKKNGITAANFWTAGSVAGITVDKPASVVMKQVGDVVELAVAEPTQKNVTLTVTLPHPAELISKSDSITVKKLTPFTQIEIDTTALGGGSSVIKLKLLPAAGRELVGMVSAVSATLNVRSNTAFADLPLPIEVSFLATDGKTYSLPLLWSRNGYEPAGYSKTTVIGTPVLEGGLLNTAGLTVKIDVSQGADTIGGGLVASQDGYVQDGTASAGTPMAGGVGDKLFIKLDGVGYHRKALFQFDLTNVPDNKDAYYFKFQFESVDKTEMGGFNGWQGGELHLLDGTFNETTVTWNNRPARAANSLLGACKGSDYVTGDIASFDVTAAVLAAKAAGKNAIAFEFATGGVVHQKNQANLWSKESGTATQKPALAWPQDPPTPPALADKRNLEYLVGVAESLNTADFVRYNAEAFQTVLTAAKAALAKDNLAAWEAYDAEDALMALLLALREVPKPTT